MYSLSSTYGPSVTSTSSPLARSTVAVLWACSPPPNTQALAALSSSLYAPTFAMIASSSAGAGGSPGGWYTLSR